MASTEDRNAAVPGVTPPLTVTNGVKTTNSVKTTNAPPAELPTAGNLLRKWIFLTSIPAIIVGIVNCLLFWFIPVIDDGGWAPKLLVLVKTSDVSRLTGAGVLVLVFLVAWILDSFTFPGTKRSSPSQGTIILWVVLGTLLSIAMYAAASDMPYLPMLFCVFVVYPILIAAIRTKKKLHVDTSWKELNALDLKIRAADFRFAGYVASESLKWREDKLRFFQGLAISSGIVGFLLLLIWGLVVYVGSDLLWEPRTYRRMADAGFNQDNFPSSFHIVQFTFYFAPALTGMALVVFSFVGTLRVKLQHQYGESDSFKDLLTVHMAVTEGQGDDRYADAGAAGKEAMKTQESIAKLSGKLHYLICILFTTTVVIYYAIKLAGSSNIGSIFNVFAGMLVFVLAILLYMNMRKLFAGYGDKLQNIPVMKSVIGFRHSHWAHAFVFMFVAPLIPFYIVASILNQMVRNCRGYQDVQEYDVEVAPSMFTKRFNYQRMMMAKWDFTQVLIKVFWLGILCFFMTVGVNLLLNVTLAAIREKISAWPLYSIIITWFAVGLIAFLLPPVPGPPVYLFGGIVIGGQAAKLIPESPALAFFVGNVITIVLSWVLKLLACAMQQKAIGQPLGTCMAIRKTVGVHKPVMRCIEMILRQPGVPMAKVAILCGGPDWPTSVLCGILRIPLKETIIGTLPIIFFIIPVVCTGSFSLQSDTNQVFSPLASLMLFISLVMVIGMGISASSEIQDRYNRYHKELTVPRQDFIDLDWMTFKDDRKAEAFVELNKWDVLNFPIKFLLVFLAFIQFACGALWLVGSSYCFQDFQVSDDTSKIVLDEFIKIPGRVGLIAFAASILLYFALLQPMLNARCTAKYADLDSEAELMRTTWELEREAKRIEMEREIENEKDSEDNRFLTVNEVLDERLPKVENGTTQEKIRRTMSMMTDLKKRHSARYNISQAVRKPDAVLS